MINIYLDMDGVLADFDSEFGKTFDKELFDYSIINNQLFEKLLIMPKAKLLCSDLKSICNYYDCDIEILSSLGSPSNDLLLIETIKQKKNWLHNNFIYDKPNFVYRKGMKKFFANPNSILIDDHQENVDDWNKHHGFGILYTEENYNDILNRVTKICQQINTTYYFRKI